MTPRERELLGYLVQGLTYAEIAATVVISEKTVSFPRLQPSPEDGHLWAWVA